MLHNYVVFGVGEKLYAYHMMLFLSYAFISIQIACSKLELGLVTHVHVQIPFPTYAESYKFLLIY